MNIEEIKEWVPNHTDMGPAHYKWLCDNNITEWPTCPACDKPVKMYREVKKGFSKYCSAACSRKNAKVIHTDITKDILVELFVNQRKTIKVISDELNQTETRITYLLKRFEITQEARKDYAQTFLADYNWVYDKYVTQNKTIKQIMVELKLPASLRVTDALKLHNIPTKKPNSYDRNESSKISKPHQSLVDWLINDLNIENVQVGNRTICQGIELDIFLPDYKLAIEYNGLYHHYDKGITEPRWSVRKDRTYHIAKTINVEKQGSEYQLIHIFDDEFIEKPDIVRSIISSKLGKHKNKFYARKLTIHHLTKGEKLNFLNKNHIQGADQSQIAIGLKDSTNTLVACMTFKKSMNDYDWELSRYCSLVHTTVVGGFSKLFKYAIKSKLISGIIVSYADRRISKGNVYYKNGFTKIQTIKPSYSYVIGPNYTTRKHRMNYTKARLIKLGAVGETEFEMAASLKLYPIWDVGKLVFTYDTKQ